MKMSITKATTMEPGFDDNYKYNEVLMTAHENGAISIHSTNNTNAMIYLYPDQAKALIDLITMSNKLSNPLNESDRTPAAVKDESKGGTR